MYADPRNSRSQQGSSGRSLQGRLSHARWPFLFWFFPTMGQTHRPLSEIRFEERRKTKVGRKRGRYREMMKRLERWERALSGAEERLGKKGTRERIACIPFDGLFPVNQGTERVFHQKDSKWIRRFEPAISANFSPASTHCFASLANYLENFASLCRHRCRRDFKGTDPIIWGNCSLGRVLVYLDTGDALSSWREREHWITSANNERWITRIG